MRRDAAVGEEEDRFTEITSSEDEGFDNDLGEASFDLDGVSLEGGLILEGDLRPDLEGLLRDIEVLDGVLILDGVLSLPTRFWEGDLFFPDRLFLAFDTLFAFLRTLCELGVLGGPTSAGL